MAGRVTGTGSRPVLDPRFFDVRFEYSYNELNTTTGLYDTKEYDLQYPELCKVEDVNGDLETYNRLDLSRYYCPKLKNFKLGGYWDNDKVGYVHMAYVKCKLDKFKQSLLKFE
jgi:hypothetical protein